jgi:hypothetical protein
MTLHFVFRTEDHRHPLVQFFRLDVEDAPAPVGGRAARLLDDEGHRIGFVHQAQLAALGAVLLSIGYMKMPPR